MARAIINYPYHPHFTDEKHESQQSEATCPNVSSLFRLQIPCSSPCVNATTSKTSLWAKQVTVNPAKGFFFHHQPKGKDCVKAPHVL